MGTRLLELSPAFRVNQRRRDIRKGVRRVGPCKMTLRFDEYGPA